MTSRPGPAGASLLRAPMQPPTQPPKRPRGRPRKYTAGSVGKIGTISNVPVRTIEFLRRVGSGSVQAGAKLILERAATAGQAD